MTKSKIGSIVDFLSRVALLMYFFNLTGFCSYIMISFCVIMFLQCVCSHMLFII